MEITEELTQTNNTPIEEKVYEIRDGLFATPEQVIAIDGLVDFLCNSKEREAVLIGKGGTGKTTVINMVAKLIKDKKMNLPSGKQERFDVYAAAPSHSACDVLRDSLEGSGIRVFTIASILGMTLDLTTGKFKVDEYGRRTTGVPIEDCNVVVFDECSMIGEKAKGYITSFAGVQTKIIYMGDFRQLPPIREKGENGNLDADSPTFNVPVKFELRTRMRQSEDSPIIPITDIIADAIENQTKVSLSEHRVSVKGLLSSVSFTSDANQLLDEMAEDFRIALNPYEVKGVSYQNEYRHKVNAAIRKRLWGDDVVNQFMVGDIVTSFETFMLNEWTIIPNSTSHVVTHVEDDTITYEYTELVSEENTFKMKHRTTKIPIRVKRLNIESKAGTFNGIPVVASDDRLFYERELKLMFDKRLYKQAYAFKERFADLQYGYCVTSHKVQGQSHDKVYVFEDDIMLLHFIPYITRLKSLYVALSRPRKKLVIFSRN